MPTVTIRPGCTHRTSPDNVLSAGDTFDASPAELLSFGDKFIALEDGPEPLRGRPENQILPPNSPDQGQDPPLLSESGDDPGATQEAAELAKSRGIDLEEVHGTGKGGRVLKADVYQYHEDELGDLDGDSE